MERFEISTECGCVCVCGVCVGMCGVGVCVWGGYVCVCVCGGVCADILVIQLWFDNTIWT